MLSTPQQSQQLIIKTRSFRSKQWVHALAAFPVFPSLLLPFSFDLPLCLSKNAGGRSESINLQVFFSCFGSHVGSSSRSRVAKHLSLRRHKNWRRPASSSDCEKRAILICTRPVFIMSDKAKDAEARLHANIRSSEEDVVGDEVGRKEPPKALTASLSKTSEIVCTPEHQPAGSTSSPSAAGPLHSPSCASSPGADVASSEVSSRKKVTEIEEATSQDQPLSHFFVVATSK